MNNDRVPLVRLGQGSFVHDYTPEERREHDHGPVEERLSHAHHSAALLIEYLDDFASELHPDFVAQFWDRIFQHAHDKRRAHR